MKKMKVAVTHEYVIHKCSECPHHVVKEDTSLVEDSFDMSDYIHRCSITGEVVGITSSPFTEIDIPDNCPKRKQDMEQESDYTICFSNWDTYRCVDILRKDGMGKVSVYLYPDSTVAEIASLYVDPTFRHRGYAKDLLRVAESTAKYMGATDTTIITEEKHIKMYKHLGYSI